MDAPREGRDDERTVVRAIRDQANVEGGVMAVREQPITDGVPVFEVDTAEELSQRLVPGVYVRAPRAVLAACGWTDTENSDTPEIVAGADWRDDAWIAEGGEKPCPRRAATVTLLAERHRACAAIAKRASPARPSTAS